jgi:hypothetical protein
MRRVHSRSPSPVPQAAPEPLTIEQLKEFDFLKGVPDRTLQAFSSALGNRASVFKEGVIRRRWDAFNGKLKRANPLGETSAPKPLGERGRALPDPASLGRLPQLKNIRQLYVQLFHQHCTDTKDLGPFTNEEIGQKFQDFAAKRSPAFGLISQDDIYATARYIEGGGALTKEEIELLLKDVGSWRDPELRVKVFDELTCRATTGLTLEERRRAQEEAKRLRDLADASRAELARRLNSVTPYGGSIEAVLGFVCGRTWDWTDKETLPLLDSAASILLANLGKARLPPAGPSSLKLVLRCIEKTDGLDEACGTRVELKQLFARIMGARHQPFL